jgi:hypothetical protein
MNTSCRGTDLGLLKEAIMAFGYEHWKSTPAGVETAQAIRQKASAVVCAAKAGHPPIRVIAADIQRHLGKRQGNAYVGRMIREWLGPTFKLMGRKKWPRKHGTESGAIYMQVA